MAGETNDEHTCKYRAALEEIDGWNPDDFKTGQGHLPMAFRTVNPNTLIRELCRVVNKVLHNTDENNRPLPEEAPQ